MPVRQRIDQPMASAPDHIRDKIGEAPAGIIQDTPPERRVGDHVRRGKLRTSPGGLLVVDAPERGMPSGGRLQRVIDGGGRPIRLVSTAVKPGAPGGEPEKSRGLPRPEAGPAPVATWRTPA